MTYLPVIRGVIDRRILINFRVDPVVLQRLLPPPLKPKLVGGSGIAGVCLIRLKDLRPRWAPAFVGLSSENAAHRIAVQWPSNSGRSEGVYIPRRNTNSRLNVLLGGRVFSGRHEQARFEVHETQTTFAMRLESGDGKTRVAVS